MEPENKQDSDTSSHGAGTAKGEEIAADEEPGFYHTGKDQTERATGGRTARASTSIRPEDREPIDPRMPEMPPA